MASPREIRLKLRIDDDGLPLDLKRVTGKIEESFDRSAKSAAAAFTAAAAEIVKSMAAIAKTPMAFEPVGMKYLDALSAKLATIQGQLKSVGAASGMALAGVPLAAAGGAGNPPRVPPTAVGAASPAPGGPNRLPSSVVIANRAAAINAQNSRAAQVVAGLSPSAGGSVSRMVTLLNSLNTAAGGVHKSISRIGPVVDRLALGFAGLGGAVAIARAVGGAFDAVAGRVRALGDNFVDAVEKSRKFEIAIGGVVGAARARDLNYSLVSGSRDLPASVADLRETGQTFAALPAIAGRLNDSNGLDQVIGLNRTIGRLATLDPAQGQQGATVALREVLEGGGGADAFNSLRRRFGLTGQTLARAVGSTLDEIREDPQLALKAVERITAALVPDSAINQTSGLFSVRLQKIRDGLDQALVKIGDAGVYDRLAGRVDRAVKGLFDAIDSDRFAAQARKISEAADRAIGAVTSAAERFLRKAVGARADQPLLDVVGDAIARGIERLAGVLENLPAVGEKIGAAVGYITSELGRLVEALSDIAAAVRAPETVAGRLGAYGEQRAWSWLTNTDLGKLGSGLGSAAAGGLRAIGNGPAPSPAVTTPATAVKAATIADGDFGRLIRQLDTAGGVLPNFGATLMANAGPFGRLDDLAREQADRLADIRGAGKTAFAASGETVGRLQEQFLRVLDQVDGALTDAENRLKTATDPGDIAQLRGGIESINRTRQQLIASFGEAGRTAADGLTEAAIDFRRGLANELAGLPLGGAAALQAAAGKNAQVDAAMAKLNAIGVTGGPTTLGAWPIRQQQNFWSRMAEREMTDLQNQSRYGSISVGMSPEQIDRAAQFLPTDRNVQQSQADLISRQLLPAQRGILNASNAALAANPADPMAVRNAAEAAEKYAELTSKLRELNDAVGELGPAFRQFADTARDAMENSLGDAIYRLISGAGDLRQVFSDLASNILREWSAMQAHLIATSLVGDMGKSQSNGTTAGAGGIFGAILGGLANAFVPGAGAAAGVAAYADGGVVNRPVLGLVGEGKHAEAIIPMPSGRVPITMSKAGEFHAMLPGGRSIPAQLHGVGMRAYAAGGIWEGRTPSHITDGGRVNIPEQRHFSQGGTDPRIYVVADMEQAVKAGLRKHQDIVVSAISGNISKGGALAKQMRGR